MSGRSRIVWLLSLVTIVGGTLAAASDLGRCETAAVRGPIVLPDGSLHQARTVQVCRTIEYSPVLVLHKISIDGRPIGLFIGRTAPLEASADRKPFLVLERDGAGRLELRGYAAHGNLHDLAPYAAEAPAAVRASWQVVARS